MAVQEEEKILLWHQRLGYLNFHGVQLLRQQDMVLGLPSVEKFKKFKACVFGKLARKLFLAGRLGRAKEKLELEHGDVCGPMQTESYCGTRDLSSVLSFFILKCFV